MISTREKHQIIHADTLFFNVGKFIWMPVLLAGIWFRAVGYEVLRPLLVCSIRSRTGIPCPGCGGTRALISFFTGYFLQSIRYHPAIVFSFCAYIHFMLLYMYRYRNKKSEYERRIPVEWYAYLLAALILGQWFVKLGFLFI